MLECGFLSGDRSQGRGPREGGQLSQPTRAACSRIMKKPAQGCGARLSRFPLQDFSLRCLPVSHHSFLCSSENSSSLTVASSPDSCPSSQPPRFHDYSDSLPTAHFPGYGSVQISRHKQPQSHRPPSNCCLASYQRKKGIKH